MNNKAEALREKIIDKIFNCPHEDEEQHADEILTLCAEVARDCVDDLFACDDPHQISHSEIEEAINKAEALMPCPRELQPYLRQYLHNDGKGYVFAFDYHGLIKAWHQARTATLDEVKEAMVNAKGNSSITTSRAAIKAIDNLRGTDI